MNPDELFQLNTGDMIANNRMDIIELLMKEDFMSCISRETKYNMNFLYTTYPFKDQMFCAIQNDPLLRFRLIDMFDEKRDDIDERLRKIHEFNNMYDLYNLNLLFSETKTRINFNNLRQIEPLLLHIEKNKLFFRDRFLEFYDNEQVIPVNQLGKRLILMYYFNSFFIEAEQTLRNNSEEYLEYKKHLIMFKDIYNGMNEKGYIFRNYREEEMPRFKCLSKYEQTILNIFNGIKTHMINKKVISWFYICFKDVIDRQVSEALLYIILNVDKNVLGMAVKIFNAFDKDYHSFTEDELEDIKRLLLEKNKYLGRVGEDITNQNINDLVNNILILKNFNVNSNTYSFLKRFDIQQLNAYIIMNLDPLTDSFENIVNQAKVKNEHLDIILREFDIEFGSDQFKTLFNSVQPNIDNLVFIKNGQIEEVHIRELEQYESIHFPIHFKELFFWYILKFIASFEILVNIKDKTLKESIERLYITLDKFKFEFEATNRESFHNGYKKLK